MSADYGRAPALSEWSPTARADFPEDLTHEGHLVQRAIDAAMMVPVRPYQAFLGVGDRCAPREDGPNRQTFGQAVVGAVCRRLALPQNRNRGLLVWHSTGSGKTCACVAAMEAFGSTRQFLYVSTRAAVDSNGREAFARCGEMYGELRTAPDNRVALPGLDPGVVAGMTFLSFTQLAHRLGIYPKRADLTPEERGLLGRSVLLMDEVHALFRPLAWQQKEHAALLDFLTGDADDPRLAGAKILILTATPGRSPQELASLLNVVRTRPGRPFEPGTPPADLRRRAAGLVSYVDISQDDSRFPTLTQETPHVVPLSPEHYAEYLTAFEPVRAQLRKMTGTDDPAAWAVAVADPDALAANEKMLAPARKRANAMPSQGPAAKLVAVARRLAQPAQPGQPGEKHYVYSSFWQKTSSGPGYGITALAELLVSRYGFEQLTADQARGGGLPPAGGKPRFALLTSRDLAGGADQERLERRTLGDVLRIFNDSTNSRGELLRVLLASQGYLEAIDLAAVRHVHLLEPQMSIQAERQAVGRAVRNCSHSQLPMRERTVVLHRYMMAPPTASQSSDDEMTIDDLVRAAALVVGATMDGMEAALKSAAVDCLASKRASGSLGPVCAIEDDSDRGPVQTGAGPSKPSKPSKRSTPKSKLPSGSR